jgi:enamine deaminase RidA (YjgF/YER057c/UK114 family)
VLDALGARLDQVVKLTVYVVDHDMAGCAFPGQPDRLSSDARPGNVSPAPPPKTPGSPKAAPACDRRTC